MATEAEALKGLWNMGTHLRGNSTGSVDAGKQRTGHLQAAQHDGHSERTESRSRFPAAVTEQLGLEP